MIATITIGAARSGRPEEAPAAPEITKEATQAAGSSSQVVYEESGSGAEPVRLEASAVKEPAAAEDPLPPSPFTEADVQLLAELMTAEAEVVMWDGYKYGVSPYARIAAVGWTALNRLDQNGGTLEEIIKAPHQFAWRSGIEAPDWMITLAADILDRYWAEKNGAENVGRTLPAGYTFFHGDGRENYFRQQYEKTGVYWDWSLPDPYDAG